ncbi:hypothetical protein GCM10022199_05340 [Marihabitans asiaticum]|nr:hypothetical protein [Marihabitans asiaticum]
MRSSREQVCQSWGEAGFGDDGALRSSGLGFEVAQGGEVVGVGAEVDQVTAGAKHGARDLAVVVEAAGVDYDPALGCEGGQCRGVAGIEGMELHLGAKRGRSAAGRREDPVLGAVQ